MIANKNNRNDFLFFILFSFVILVQGSALGAAGSVFVNIVVETVIFALAVLFIAFQDKFYIVLFG